MSDTISLADWIEKQIGEGKRFRNNTEIAKTTDLSEKTIRRLRAGYEPGLSTLRKLANGLQYPLDQLQRMAGILADDPEVLDDTTHYINTGLKRLSPKNRRAVQRMIESLLSEQDEDD